MIYDDNQMCFLAVLVTFSKAFGCSHNKFVFCDFEVWLLYKELAKHTMWVYVLNHLCMPSNIKD